MKRTNFFVSLLLFAVLLSIAAAGVLQAFAESEPAFPRLNDGAELLTGDESAALLEKLDALSEKYSFDVVIATVPKIEVPENENGENAVRSYADDYFDYNGFGQGAERDGVLLLVCMDPRKLWISTCGFGITAFTDRGQDYIWDRIQPLAADGDFNGMFKKFAALCDSFIDEAKNGKPYDGSIDEANNVEPYDMPKKPLRVLNAEKTLIAIVIGFLTAYLSAKIKRSKLTSVVPQKDAQHYEKEGSPNITESEDRFISRVVTTAHIPRSSNGGGSGSHTHTSSSGTSHGGSGRSF